MKVRGSMIAYEIMIEYQRERKFKHFIEKRKDNTLKNKADLKSLQNEDYF